MTKRGFGIFLGFSFLRFSRFLGFLRFLVWLALEHPAKTAKTAARIETGWPAGFRRARIAIPNRGFQAKSHRPLPLQQHALHRPRALRNAIFKSSNSCPQRWKATTWSEKEPDSCNQRLLDQCPPRTAPRPMSAPGSRARPSWESGLRSLHKITF